MCPGIYVAQGSGEGPRGCDLEVSTECGESDTMPSSGDGKCTMSCGGLAEQFDVRDWAAAAAWGTRAQLLLQCVRPQCANRNRTSRSRSMSIEAAESSVAEKIATDNR